MAQYLQSRVRLAERSHYDDEKYCMVKTLIKISLVRLCVTLILIFIDHLQIVLIEIRALRTTPNSFLGVGIC
jgi:hypothetical protein